mmetsp:Transcript_14880/g.35439  ORF Transcript_14880/g.35439 Transcript_14880/m.35439 type:complete len:254 (+) Transcript_14880:627-1388(+)
MLPISTSALLSGARGEEYSGEGCPRSSCLCSGTPGFFLKRKPGSEGLLGDTSARDAGAWLELPGFPPPTGVSVPLRFASTSAEEPFTYAANAGSFMKTLKNRSAHRAPARKPKALLSQLECQALLPVGLTSAKAIEPPYRKSAAISPRTVRGDTGRCQMTAKTRKEKNPQSSLAIPQCVPARAKENVSIPPKTLIHRNVRTNTVCPWRRRRNPSAQMPMRLLSMTSHDLCTKGDPRRPTRPSGVRGLRHMISV